MNTIVRTWLTLKHRGKFAKLGVRCQFPIRDLTVEGHVELGDRCRFRNNVTLRTHGDGRIVFDHRSGCSWGCLVEASSLIEIGTYTAIAEYSVICDTVWDFCGHAGSWRRVPRHARPIRIGPACFVGSGCYIGPGVTIGEGAVIATHSVVTRDVGPYEVWAGAPARKVGHRTEGVPEAKLQEFRDLVAQQGIRGDRYR